MSSESNSASSHIGPFRRLGKPSACESLLRRDHPMFHRLFLAAVLTWADLFASYAMFVMMTYLTDVWNESSTRAAGILNIWNGIAKVLPIAFALFLGVLGNFRILLFSSIAFTIGLGFLALSTPPVTGSCSAYKPECIGHTQKVLFYIALALVAVGVSGHSISLQPFMDEQNEDEINDKKDEAVTNQSPKAEQQVDNPPVKKEEGEYKVIYQTLGVIIVVIVSIGGGVVLQYIKPWSLRFGIPAICTLVATLVFTTVRWSKSYNLTNQAIEKTKISISMIPVLLTFIICGLVLSVGNTYFLEQANTMNRKLGRVKVPLSILLLFYNFVKAVFQSFYIGSAYTLSDTSGEVRAPEEGEDTVPDQKRMRIYAPPIGIGFAMVFSILCCITAARIETARLHVIRDHGLLDKPDETVPMTVFKLFPQFLLLAAFDGIFGKSTVDFFVGQGFPTLSKIFIGGMSGLGIMSSVLSVYVVGKISERGGKPNWFQESLSNSRLDRYYWTLAALSAVNFVFFIVVASCCYSYKNADQGDVEGRDDQGLQEPNTDS